METRTVKTIKIFLASSSELHDDLIAFADFILRLQHHYEAHGINFQLMKWEYLDASNNNKRKQDEYNEAIRQCDVFVALFSNVVGKYTLEELDFAFDQSKKRNLPLFIYFKDLSEEKESHELNILKHHILSDLGYYWGNYNTNDKLHLDFVLWLDSFLFGGNTPIKVENNMVTMGGEPIAVVSQLPFFTKNSEYQLLETQIESLSQNIAQIQQETQNHTDNIQLSNELSQKIIKRDSLLADQERIQESLLNAARRIADIKTQQVNDSIQKAITAYESGDIQEANAILTEIANESDIHLDNIKKSRALLYRHIDALKLQAETTLTNSESPIEDRIFQVSQIYAKADSWAERSSYNKEDYARLLFDYAQFLNQFALYSEAEKVYLRQISLSEELYGIESNSTTTSYNSIGKVYFAKGEYNKAMEYYNKAFEIEKRIYNEDHLETATTFNNIGEVYDIQGDYTKAMNYYSKALEIHEKLLGTEHPTTATSLHHIGKIYNALGDYLQAIKQLYKALSIRKKTLSDKHPDIATSYNEIGKVYCNQKDYQKALERHFKSLEICEEMLGNKHPDTATSYSNIGIVYNRQGDYVKALEYHLKALKIREKVLGNKHPSTAASYNNIGIVYNRQNNYQKALDYHFKALKIKEKSLGESHPSTAKSYNNIGIVYNRQRNYSRALEYHLKALAIKEKTLGTNHPETALSYSNIGLIYSRSGSYSKALEYLKKAHLIYEKTLGDKNSSTISIKKRIAFVNDQIKYEHSANRAKAKQKLKRDSTQKSIKNDIGPISIIDNEDESRDLFYPPVVNLKNTSFVPNEKTIILLNEIICCARFASEGDESFLKAMSTLAEELRTIFESEYCAIGTYMNDIAEDCVVSYENTGRNSIDNSSHTNQNDNSNSKTSSKNSVQLILNSPKDISILNKKDIKKFNIYKEYQGKLKKGEVINTTVISIQENNTKYGYIQFINSEKPIDEGMILSLKDAFLGLIQIIIFNKKNEQELRRKENRIKDMAFYDRMKNNLDNVDTLFDEIMKYFSEVFNAAIVTFRIPVLNGNNRTPFFFLRRIYIHPSIEKSKREILMNHYHSDMIIKNKTHMNILKELRCDSLNKVLISKSHSSFSNYGMDLDDNTLIMPIIRDFGHGCINPKRRSDKYCRSGEHCACKSRFKRLYGFFRLRISKTDLTNNENEYISDNKETIERLSFLSNQITLLIDSLVHKSENASLQIFQNELKNSTFVKINEFDKRCAEIIKESAQANVCSVYRYDSRSKLLTMSATTAISIRLNDNNINIFANSELDQFCISVNSPNNVLANVINTKQTHYAFDLKDSSVHQSPFIESLNIELDNMNKTAMAVPMINKEGTCTGLVLLLGKDNPKRSVSTSYWEHDINHIEFIVNILTRISESDTERLTFLSQLSHELLAPVTEQVYDNDLTLAIAEREPHSFSEQHLLSKLRENIDRNMLFKYIISDTEFIYSSSASGRSIDYNIVKQDRPQEILLDAVRLMEKEAYESKGLSIVTSISEMPSLFFDKERMMQVFLNLLKNAIRYADRDTKICISYTKKNDNFHEICFANYGIGVQEAEKESIFELFSRGSLVKKKFIRGTGMGLFIIRNIMRAHGGECYVKRLNNPTVFAITLPNK